MGRKALPPVAPYESILPVSHQSCCSLTEEDLYSTQISDTGMPSKRQCRASSKPGGGRLWTSRAEGTSAVAGCGVAASTCLLDKIPIEYSGVLSTTHTLLYLQSSPQLRIRRFRLLYSITPGSGSPPRPEATAESHRVGIHTMSISLGFQPISLI